MIFVLWSLIEMSCDAQTMRTRNDRYKCEIVVERKPPYDHRVFTPRGIFTYKEICESGWEKVNAECVRSSLVINQ